MYVARTRNAKSGRLSYHVVFRIKVISARRIRGHCIIPDPRRPRQSDDREPILDVRRAKYRIALKTHRLFGERSHVYLLVVP